MVLTACSKMHCHYEEDRSRAVRAAESPAEHRLALSVGSGRDGRGRPSLHITALRWLVVISWCLYLCDQNNICFGEHVSGVCGVCRRRRASRIWRAARRRTTPSRGRRDRRRRKPSSVMSLVGANTCLLRGCCGTIVETVECGVVLVVAAKSEVSRAQEARVCTGASWDWFIVQPRCRAARWAARTRV